MATRAMAWAGRASVQAGGAIPAARTPESLAVSEGEALESVLDATRALLWIETPSEAASLARSLVELLGGSVETGPRDGVLVLPLDLSFGEGEPMRPGAPTGSAEHALLERYLPAFVRDTGRALELVDRASRLAEEAAVDVLTGVANRRTLGRVLARLRPRDTVIVLDLDHFKIVNDRLGHDVGDAVLRSFGAALTTSVRASDRVGRYGGEEFVVVITGDAGPFLERFKDEWVRVRRHPVTFSAGVAPAEPDPRRALKAADRAMYRAKMNGRDQWQWATPEEYR